LSRLQRFDLKRIGTTEIIARLETVLKEEKIEATREALSMIARAADGSMRDALSLTDQVVSLDEGSVTADRVRIALGLVAEDEYLRVLDMIAGRRAGEAFDVVRKLADAGVDFGVFLSGLADILRAQLALLLGGTTEGLSNEARKALESHRDQYTSGDVLRMLSTLAELEPQFRKSSQQQLLVEMLLVRFALFDRAVSIEDMLRGLSGSGESSGGGREVTKPSAAPTRPRPVERDTRRNAPLADARAQAPPPRSEPTSQEITEPTGSAVAMGIQEAAPDWKLQYEQTANDAGRPRLTEEAVRAERLASMRAKDPVLAAAIDELDLELLD
jgi:DNA polymerase-3 subunit gamma/tau